VHVQIAETRPFSSLSWAWERGYSCSHLQLPIQQSRWQTLVCLLPETEHAGIMAINIQ